MMLTACSNKDKENRRVDKANDQLDMIEKYVKNGVLYDVGAAAGFYMYAAKIRGWTVYGNDLSTLATKWAKEKYDIDIFNDFMENDPNTIDQKFDLVVFWNTLEHMLNPIATMSRVNSMLKSKGYVHIRVPIKNKNTINKFYEAGHTVEFNNEALDLLRIKNNLQLVEKNTPQSRVPCVDLIWRKP